MNTCKIDSSPQKTVRHTWNYLNKPNCESDINDLYFSKKWKEKEEYDCGTSLFSAVSLNKRVIQDINIIPIRMPLFSEISEIGNLKEDWDGYGGIEISNQIVNSTLHFVKKLKIKFLIYLSVDGIYPNPHGTISLEFKNTNKDKLIIEIGENYSNFLLKINGKYQHGPNLIIDTDADIPSEIYKALKLIDKDSKIKTLS